MLFTTGGETVMLNNSLLMPFGLAAIVLCGLAFQLAHAMQPAASSLHP
jgi:hypothetical protein